MVSRIQQGIAKEHPEWVIPRLCQQEASKTGIIVAIVTGLISLPIARRIGLDKNKSLFSALGTSSVGGYVASKHSYAQCEATYGFPKA
ncbi:hypothetical protein BY458DRAFT_559895 [Sporodiniella umbellata]|nr:hypothetical protein BY458DRAFT_559895 [Sporodiniella umbellata]